MIRIWTISVLMVLAVAGAQILTPDRLAAGREALDLEEIVPDRVGEWQLVRSVRPVLPREREDDQSLAARIYDQTLVRTYRNPKGDHVMMVIAYGRNQSDALQLHLPEACYASQGFAVKRAGRADVVLDDDRKLPVARLTTRRGTRYEPVTYWTRVGDRVSLSMLHRQWAKLSYGMRGRLPDGVLIRISTISSRSDYAFSVQEHFIRDLIRSIDRDTRPFFLGGRAG